MEEKEEKVVNKIVETSKSDNKISGLIEEGFIIAINHEQKLICLSKYFERLFYLYNGEIDEVNTLYGDTIDLKRVIENYPNYNIVIFSIAEMKHYLKKWSNI
jgi:hypothetical protein